MKEYPKIESLFNRDEKTHRFKLGDFRRPEFEYLWCNDWEATEKVDGMNIRVNYSGDGVGFYGRTDRAQLPVPLVERLAELFPLDAFKGIDPMTLYGEGYGAKIQKGGGNYKADGVDFVLFDVRCGDWWLRRSDVADVAEKLGIKEVPTHYAGGLDGIEKMVAQGFTSAWGAFDAEGVVCRPAVEMNTRSGERIIVKIKTKDFAGGVKE